MDLDDLPKPIAAAIEELVSDMQKAVDSSSVHTKHLVHSWLNGASLVGGTIPIQQRKPVKYDKRAFSSAVRSILEQEESIRSLIIACERDDVDDVFAFSTKLISRDDYQQLVSERAKIDRRVIALLEGLAPKDTERLRFGRSKIGGPSMVTIVSKADGKQNPEPSTDLLACLADAEALYERFGHRLEVAVWSIRNGEPDFSDYFE